MKYAHLAARLFNTPLYLSEAKGEVIAAVLLSRMRADSTDLIDIEDQEPPTERVGSLAVINITGSLVHKSGGMKAMSGMRSYADITSEVNAAKVDSGVSGILLRCDSPGGEVSGMLDCADAIMSARKVKPVWAIAEDMAASAAYALASQADRLYVTQTGMVGSIGVIMMHFDMSDAEKKAGVVVTTLFRGEHKADFSPHGALSKGALDWANSFLDQRYAQLATAVVRGRAGKIDAKGVQRTEAQLYSDAAEAQKLGLIDGVSSFPDLINEFSASISGKRARPAAALASANSRMENAMEQETITAPAPAAAAPPAAPALPNATEMRQQIEASVRAEMAEINELCALAGQPALASDFITKNVKPEAVRKELLRAKAEAATATEIYSHVAMPDGSAKNKNGKPGDENLSAAGLMRESLAKKGAN